MYGRSGYRRRQARKKQKTLLLNRLILFGFSGSRVNSDGSVSHPVHQFHDTHGENVRLSADRSTARRVKSFCNGIAFSKLQVRPNEKVTKDPSSSSSLKIKNILSVFFLLEMIFQPFFVSFKINLRVTECSTKWLGALEIGFTSCNPFSLSGVLPNDFSGRTSLYSGSFGRTRPF